MKKNGEAKKLRNKESAFETKGKFKVNSRKWKIEEWMTHILVTRTYIPPSIFSQIAENASMLWREVLASSISMASGRTLHYGVIWDGIPGRRA
jgi:hypothetical protein